MGSVRCVNDDNQSIIAVEVKSRYFWILGTIDKVNSHHKCSYRSCPCPRGEFQGIDPKLIHDSMKNPVNIKWSWNYAPNTLMTSNMAWLPAPWQYLFSLHNIVCLAEIVIAIFYADMLWTVIFFKVSSRSCEDSASFKINRWIVILQGVF